MLAVRPYGVLRTESARLRETKQNNTTPAVTYHLIEVTWCNYYTLLPTVLTECARHNPLNPLSFICTHVVVTYTLLYLFLNGPATIVKCVRTRKGKER